MNWREIVEDTARKLLRDSVAAHQRRCAIRQGVRETDKRACLHADWDYGKKWCRTCGMTLREYLNGEV